MGSRKVMIRPEVAESIAAIAWYIESKGMLTSAERFSNDVYYYIQKLARDEKNYKICREPVRASLGYKCVSYKKKYTVAFIETDNELIVCEFTSSKLIYW
jgi:hypothetical protein